MQAEAILASMKVRLAANKSGGITINADEVAEWPQGLFERLLEAKILTQAEPSQVLECRGCEEYCFMPVNIIVAEGTRPARAFVACDKPENFGRVRVDFSRLLQWRLTQSGFERLQSTWVVSTATDARQALKKSKAPLVFRNALEKLLVEIEERSRAQNLAFNRFGMPGRKCDFQAMADKFDANLERSSRTFDDYLEGLCAFKRGARETDFYFNLFPEYTK